MDAYFDTAIILKLSVQEATSADAARLANESPTPYLRTPWQEIEARAALRLKAFRKEITLTEMQASLVAFDEDILSGRWKTPEYSETTVWRFARGLSDRPGTPQYAARLLQNPGDLAAALEPYYGTAAADQFGDLVRQHLLISVDILNAAKAGNTDAFNARDGANHNAAVQNAGPVAFVNALSGPASRSA